MPKFLAELINQAGLVLNPATKTANFTVDPTVTSLYFCVPNVADITATLPAASSYPGVVMFFKQLTSSYKTTLDAGAGTIDGVGTLVLSTAQQAAGVSSDGIKWYTFTQLPLPTIGTAFPTVGLYQGRPFDRSDLMRRGWYDLANSRWVSEPYELTWIIRATSLQPFPGNDWVYQAAQHDTYSVVLDRWDSNTFISGTNNGSNYWTVDLNDDTNAARATFNTSAQGGSTWTGGHRSTGTFTGNPFSTSNKYFEIKITKTGAPGNLYLGVMLRARDVLT
jgi:hypothetical protein